MATQMFNCLRLVALLFIVCAPPPSDAKTVQNDLSQWEVMSPALPSPVAGLCTGFFEEKNTIWPNTACFFSRLGKTERWMAPFLIGGVDSNHFLSKQWTIDIERPEKGVTAHANLSNDGTFRCSNQNFATVKNFLCESLFLSSIHLRKTQNENRHPRVLPIAPRV